MATTTAKQRTAHPMSYYREMVKDMDDSQKRELVSILIERTLPRRRPTISRWAGYHMANTDRWYYAYTIEGDTITVVDACHAQNMHD